MTKVLRVLPLLGMGSMAQSIHRRIANLLKKSKQVASKNNKDVQVHPAALLICDPQKPTSPLNHIKIYLTCFD